MKLRSFFSGLIALVAALLLIGVVGFYWITANSPLKLLTAGVGKVPSAAIFIPRQAPAMMSLLVNPEEVTSLRQAIADPAHRRQARAELEQFQQSLLADTGLTYAQDIQPWLGDEVTLAITTLDIDRDATNGKQPGYLLAIATQDPERSREFLQVFWQKRAIAGTDLTFEQYKGVKLIYNEVPIQAEGKAPQTDRPRAGDRNQQPGAIGLSPYALRPSPALASAVVGDQFVLFANDPKVLRNAITNVQAPELNLASATFYQQALKTLTQPRIGLAFVNLPGVAGWLETESITPPKGGSDAVPVKPSGGKAQTLVMAVQVARQGLIAETATVGMAQAAIAPPLTQPVAALNYIPATSSWVAAGTNLNQFWQQLSTSLAGYSRVSQWINDTVQNVAQQKQVNLPQDVFRWVTQEYALARVPSLEPNVVDAGKRSAKRRKGAPAALPLEDWVFVAERGTETASTAIAHLDDLARQQGYSVGTVALGEQTVAAWTKLTPGDRRSKTLEAKVEGVHTTVGQYEVFATSLAAMEQALTAEASSLLNTDRFQQAIAPFPQPNNGYLYLDWIASRPTLEQRFPFLKVVQLAGGPLFSHLQSFAVSSYGSQDAVQRSSIFIQLKPL